MDKQKQIEEIQNILPNIEVIRCMWNDFNFAEFLYDRGCRKILDGAVILTKEAYAELIEIKRLQEMFDGDVVKQTAYTILREIGTANLLKRGQCFGDLSDEEKAALKPYCDRMLRKIKELAKRYDVKVTADKEGGE